VADALGEWSITPSQLLLDGTYALTASATDTAGNDSASSPITTLTVDTSSATPAITGAQDNVLPQTGNVTNGGSSNDATPTLSGTAEPFAAVKVWNGATEVGSTIANAAGQWSVTTSPLADGMRALKATAIDRATIDAEGVYRHTGPARVFASERAAMAAIKQGAIVAGDVLVLAGIGPMGTGMEETYQVTSALKQLPCASRVALITDARFSGVSTGACVGHVGPEALAGGPIGKLVEGDTIAIVIDTRTADGSIERMRFEERVQIQRIHLAPQVAVVSRVIVGHVRPAGRKQPVGCRARFRHRVFFSRASTKWCYPGLSQTLLDVSDFRGGKFGS
jgi:hypothetical protein